MQGLLKVFMIIIGLIVLLLWGLVPLFASPTVAGWFNLTHAGEFVHWVRFFGMMAITWGLMMICAAFNTEKNKLIVSFSILLFIFAAVMSLLMMYWLGELDTGKWIWWVNLVLSVIFALLLLIFYPWGKAGAKPAPPPAE